MRRSRGRRCLGQGDWCFDGHKRGQLLLSKTQVKMFKVHKGCLSKANFCISKPMGSYTFVFTRRILRTASSCLPQRMETLTQRRGGHYIYWYNLLNHNMVLSSTRHGHLLDDPGAALLTSSLLTKSLSGYVQCRGGVVDVIIHMHTDYN